MKSERFGDLVNLATKGENLPEEAKRSLAQAIVQVGLAFPTDDPERMQEYYIQILQPLQNRFKEIICNQEFQRNYYHEGIRLQIIDILETLIGNIK